MAQGVSGAHAFHLHVIHDVTCLSVRCLSSFCLLPLYVSLLPFLFHCLPVLCPAQQFPQRHRRGLKTTALTHNEEYCAVAIYTPLTGYEPNIPDDFHNSETTEIFFQEQSGDIDTEPSYSCDAELDDETIGKALSSPLFIQEREEPANLRQAYHSHAESVLPAQSFFANTSTVRPENELSSYQKRKSSRDMENERIRILLERQKEQILADVRIEIQKHELQAESDRRSIQQLNGIIESRRREIDHTIASDEQFRRDQPQLQEQLSEQNRDLRDAHIKSLREMEEL